MNAARARMIWSVVTWTIVLAVVFPLIWMILTSVRPSLSVLLARAPRDATSSRPP